MTAGEAGSLGWVFLDGGCGADKTVGGHTVRQRCATREALLRAIEDWEANAAVRPVLPLVVSEGIQGGM